MQKIKPVGIGLDQKTLDLLEQFEKTHSLGRSSVIRLALSEFFLDMENKQ